MMDTEERTEDSAWREVGQQFQSLGESLSRAFRSAWESVENRQHLQEVRVGLESMVREVGQAIDEAVSSPEAQRAKEEMDRVVASAHTAGREALDHSRPYLVSALSRISDELQEIARRLEGEKEDVDGV
ncbi:MAG: hypothetical protein JW900_15770 [Anaerolineae bacterium]|nr:hypothetical protein [Anaerolineae bacterium]